jgi:hypothetical protein
MLLNGEGGHAEPQRAADLLLEGCRAEDVFACGQVAPLIAKGEQVERNVDGALDAYWFACRQSNSDFNFDREEHCVSYGLLVRSDARTVEDFERGRQAFQVACELGSVWGCLHLGEWQTIGQGGAVDLRRAKRNYQNGCDAGVDAACEALRTLPVSQEDAVGLLAETEQYFQQQCDAGDAGACMRLQDLERWWQ